MADEFRAALLAVPPRDRDAWVDRTFGLDDIPADGPALPRGCVPYLPAPVDALLHVAEHVHPTDTFVDVGSGAGRAIALVQLLTGASAIGLEIQPALVAASRALVERLGLSRVEIVEGDAADTITTGSVFFLYCPFDGNRLQKLLARLPRPSLVCCLDLPLPASDRLTLIAEPAQNLSIYRSA